jgi:hypothetical protein
MLCLGRKEQVSQRNFQQMKEILVASAVSPGFPMKEEAFSLGLGRMRGY